MGIVSKTPITSTSSCGSFIDIMISQDNLKKGFYNLKTHGFFKGYESYEVWVEKTHPEIELKNDTPLKEPISQKEIALEKQRQEFWNATGDAGEHKLYE